MNSNASFTEVQFGDFNVSDSVLESVIEYLEANGPTQPDEVIQAVSQEERVSKHTVQRAIRELQVWDDVIPAPPFTGEMQVSELQYGRN